MSPPRTEVVVFFDRHLRSQTEIPRCRDADGGDWISLGDHAVVMLRPEQDLSLSIRQGFVRRLPHLRRLLWCSFRYEKPEQCSESVSEAIAFAFKIYKSAREFGKDVDVRPLARFAALHVKSGARFAGTHRLDATNSRTRNGPRAIQCRPLTGALESVLPDRRGHWPVSDQVAFRMDWSAFMSRCSRKDRLAVDLLAAGYRKNEVARRMKVTPSAVTQRTNQLRNRWQAFQG
jgi:hypothetical protein